MNQAIAHSITLFILLAFVLHSAVLRTILGSMLRGEPWQCWGWGGGWSLKCPGLEPGLAACQANVLPLSSLQLLTVNSVGLGIVLYHCSQKGKEIVFLCLYVFFLSLSLCLYWDVRSTSEGFHKLGEVGGGN